MNLSINPFYYCNFRCSFCYLTEAQLSDKRVLPIPALTGLLNEVSAVWPIEHVDIYGGEVTLLPKAYFLELKEILIAQGVESVNINTNLSFINEIVQDPFFSLSVSYDFNAREKHEIVFNNMLMLARPFSVLTLASRELLDTVTPDEYVMSMNMLGNLHSAEIKPYSTNQANNAVVSFKEFEDFVWAVICHPKRNFAFQNEANLNAVLEDPTKNSFSDDHIYITPNGKLAVLEFDQDDREFFLELDDIAAYQRWCSLERERVSKNAFCSQCDYFGRCLSEHLRDIKTAEDSCSGFKGLILKWVDDENC